MGLGDASTHQQLMNKKKSLGEKVESAVSETDVRLLLQSPDVLCCLGETCFSLTDDGDLDVACRGLVVFVFERYF